MSGKCAQFAQDTFPTAIRDSFDPTPDDPAGRASQANAFLDATPNDESIKASHDRALRASAQLQFDRLLRSLSLPPERADAFLQCIAAHHRKLLTAAREIGAGVPASILSENARFEVEMKALLGEQDCQKYREVATDAAALELCDRARRPALRYHRR